jgi:multidrug transporter EmrE-like cation transporter
MHWFFLTFAILAEVAGTICMKLSAGFTKTTPSVLMWLSVGLFLFSPWHLIDFFPDVPHKVAYN